MAAAEAKTPKGKGKGTYDVSDLWQLFPPKSDAMYMTELCSQESERRGIALNRFRHVVQNMSAGSAVETEVKIEGGIAIEEEAENRKGKAKGKEDGRVPNTPRSTEYAHQNRSPPLLAWPRREG